MIFHANIEADGCGFSLGAASIAVLTVESSSFFRWNKSSWHDWRAQRSCEAIRKLSAHDKNRRHWYFDVPLMRPLPLLLLAVALGSTTAAVAGPLECLVMGVSDGESITARCGEPGFYEQVKVRINGIDAPEKSHPLGSRAKAALSNLVYLRDVELDCVRNDHRSLRVCRVHVAPASAPHGPLTLDVGLAMVTAGMARRRQDDQHSQTPQERRKYELAEADAQARGVALWADKGATALEMRRKEARQASAQ